MRNLHTGHLIDRRRFLTAAGTASGAGIVGLGWRSAGAATVSHPPGRRVPPAPSPIPGGIELAPGFVIHVFAPGDPAVTLPFSGITLAGVDVEPSTITDFNGSSAVAYHLGTARASDGSTYNFETDIRAFEGEYVVDGETHHGSFAMV
jgi:hypothetical protein